MIVLIVESVPPSLRGELSKWLLEPQAGVFVGNVSGAVRDLLWEKACQEAGVGNCTLIQPAANEQGYIIRTWGETRRVVEEWEGLYLVRRPKPKEKLPITGDPPQDWNEYLHPYIWAKTARGVVLASDEPDYHPLACHMIDTAMVALQMWKKTLPAAIKEEMRSKLRLPDMESTGRWIAFFIGLHDLGKATPAFQRKWQEGWARLVKLGFVPSDSQETSPHHVLSTYLLIDLLNGLGLDRNISLWVAAVVGAHHGSFARNADLNSCKRLIGGSSWQTAQAQLLRLLAHVLRLDELEYPTGNLCRQNGFLLPLAGFCSVADWIASNHECFQYVGDTVILPYYVEHSEHLAAQALERLGWLDRPRDMQVQDFTELFQKVPNSLQYQVIEMAETLNGPSLVLLEYPMGGGKTEAALWLADYLACTAGQKGLYFALPTMATSNQMFGRVNSYLSERFPDTSINTMLLHGHASLNAEFEVLRKRGRHTEGFHIEEKKAEGLLVAEWFTYRKRGLLSPYGIGTIDQALLAVLQTPHFFVRLFGLAGKVVVLDEVHAYDSYMQALLAQLLTWLAACHTSVILLSATLPAHTRQALIDAYALGRGQTDVELPQIAYPRISVITESGCHSRHITGAPTRFIGLRLVPEEKTQTLGHDGSNSGVRWMQMLREQLQAGGCAAVILNTVGRAQEVYQGLKQYFSDEELYLLHARFPFDMRMERETAILGQFGPPDHADRPRRAVVVSTQILEQSLDLDFDLMVTDLAPIDLVLQRSGRLWRHQRSRPASCKEPTLWLLMPELDSEGAPIFDTGSARVYNEHTLFRSWLALRARESIEIPAEMDSLIESVYRPMDAPPDLPPHLQAVWRSSKQNLEEQIFDMQRKAKEQHIRGINEDVVSMPMKSLAEDAEELHPVLQALTRLGGVSVTVVCLYDDDGTLLTVGPKRERIVLRKPNQDEVRALLGSSLRISFAPYLVKRILALDPPAEWADSPHLRRCRLLTFDLNGNCLMPEIPLKLDEELGLYVLRKEDQSE